LEARANIELKHAFVLRASEVRKVWSFLSDSIGTVKATVSCVDHLERVFSSVEELANYENSRPRAIRSVSFTARSQNSNASAHLRLRGDSYSSISLDVEGPEPAVSQVRDRLSEVFDGMRPWYSAISRIDFFFVILGIIFFAFLVLRGMHVSDTPEKSLTLLQALWLALIFIGIFLAIGALIFFLNWLRRRFFPVACFTIGQGEDRYNFDEKVRWAVLVGFVVSLFASLVAAFLLPKA